MRNANEEEPIDGYQSHGSSGSLSGNGLLVPTAPGTGHTTSCSASSEGISSDAESSHTDEHTEVPRRT